MHARSVLANVTAADIVRTPFPHVVIDNCLPEEYYQALAAAYPPMNAILQLCRTNPHRAFSFVGEVEEQNSRYDLSAFQILDRPGRVSKIWLDFVRYHTSGAFFQEVATLFGKEIRLAYPFLEEAVGRPLVEWSSGVRHASDCDISLDCQIGINTAVSRASSVRRVHTDAPVELFAILLYFKGDDDDTQGGDLQLYRWKDQGVRLFLKEEVHESDAELVATIEYQTNTMVMFLNTMDSLHAVTPRQPSAHIRRLVNIIGEVDKSLPSGLFVKEKRKALRYASRKIVARGKRLLGR